MRFFHNFIILYKLYNYKYKILNIKYILLIYKMGLCYLCERQERESYWSHYCTDCRRLKHYINLFDKRVYEILDNVLTRTEDKQNNKIKEEIKTEIEKKAYSLRSGDSKNTSKQSKN